MKSAIWLLIGLTLFSCSGIDDLIFDRHPQLSDISLSRNRVAAFDTVSASIIATNPIDGALDYRWIITHVETGVGSSNGIIGTNDTDSIKWIAPIQGGVYEFKVIVENTAKSSEKTKQLEVIVSERPVVDLRKPVAGAYFVVGQTIDAEVRAEHANGLSWVRIYLNQTLMAEQDQNSSGIYNFEVSADSSMVGTAVLKIEAKSAVVNEPGSDSIEIEIGGIIPGKNGN